MNRTRDLGLDANARRACYPNAHLIIKFGVHVKKNNNVQAISEILKY